MSRKQSEGDKSYLWCLAGGLCLYCVVLTAITGDIGFSGDDWWVLACPYWNSFPDALALYTCKFLRPAEGLYWISLFKVFGFSRVVFHLCSLLLLAGSASLMGVALDRAFPDRRGAITIAVLLAFFLPPLSCLTYVMFTDNSRLSMLLFWISVIAFQRWARKPSSWSGLTFPVLIYVASFITYETSGFLIFVVPLLVWPVLRCRSDPSSDSISLTKLCTGTLVAFVAAVALRLVLLSGGAVRTSFYLPPFELLWSYLALLPFYLLAPFTSMTAHRWAIVLGCFVALGTVCLFLFSSRNRPMMGQTEAQEWLQSRWQWYMVALGAGILVLGMLPYQLAGYGSFAPRLVETLMVKRGLLPEGDLSWFNFTWSSRIYSSASFGVAILLACALSGRRRSSAEVVGKTVAVAIIGIMAAFHCGLGQDWREAAEIRNDLMRSLVSQVPAVKPGTNFVFLDVSCSHKRAEVIREENGLRELVQMIYADQSLAAWRLYPDAYDRFTHMCRQAVATPEGFQSCPGQRQSQLAPPETLLLFRRSGRELVLLDKITAGDGSVHTGIAWRGTEHLASNLERIQTWSEPVSHQDRLAADTAWSSGLMSTLRLTRLDLTLRPLRHLKYLTLKKTFRRSLFRMRLHRIKVGL